MGLVMLEKRVLLGMIVERISTGEAEGKKRV
jgi:hypothetical protein